MNRKQRRAMGPAAAQLVAAVAQQQTRAEVVATLRQVSTAIMAQFEDLKAANNLAFNPADPNAVAAVEVYNTLLLHAAATLEASAAAPGDLPARE